VFVFARDRRTNGWTTSCGQDNKHRQADEERRLFRFSRFIRRVYTGFLTTIFDGWTTIFDGWTTIFDGDRRKYSHHRKAWSDFFRRHRHFWAVIWGDGSLPI
jgi:hypothetical protein